MNLKRLINKSVYGTIGYLQSYSDIELLSQYISYNYPILKEFKQIVVATNYGSPLQSENTLLWKTFFPNCIILDSELNRGHNIGTADLDNLIFDWCKQNGEEWLCKSANDVILQESLLDKEIENSDFYYLTSVGYGALFPPFEITTEKIYNTNEYFYPQTNFYLINVSKTDYINPKEHLDEIYNILQTISDPDEKAWDHGFRTCEVLLKESVERNNLSTFNLIPQEKFNILLDIIKKFRVNDPSHKNIMIEGICHCHYPTQQIVKI
jgi:hypothetical protein